ncbi:MAG: ion transporter [Bacteroidota bacterium]
MSKQDRKLSPWRERIFEVIFGTDTPSGKFFDVVLLVFIVASVLAVMLETVGSIERNYRKQLILLEWVFTGFFTLEYILRLLSTRRPWRYATSFFGVIDLLAILPTYLSFFIAGTKAFLIVRILRLLRVFRIFKLTKFLNESAVITRALGRSREKITVFLVFIFLMVIILGSLMYLVEGGAENTGFTSIPRSIYWAIVTLTTVGYGDIAPTTDLGQFVAAIIMIMGYGVIAVPTGIVGAEMAFEERNRAPSNHDKTCRHCGKSNHELRAKYCSDCGSKL